MIAAPTTTVVVVCPSCHGTGATISGEGLATEVFACCTCEQKGFCEALLWTVEDQRKKIQEAEERASEQTRREAKRAAEKEKSNPLTHWRREPFPAGWTTRYSSKHGPLPVRGRVRVVDVANSRRTTTPRYRVEVLDEDARAWVPHRKDNGRIFYTQVLPRAYEAAETLYIPSKEELEEAEKAASYASLVTDNEAVLRTLPHPSWRHPHKNFWDWVVWMQDHGHDPEGIRFRIEQVLQRARTKNTAPPNPLDEAPKSFHESLGVALEDGVSDLLSSAEALSTALSSPTEEPCS